MAFNVSFNGTTYPLPSVGDRIYATYINTFLTAVANNALAKSGGTFTLTADVNFGATYGPVVAYIKSRSSNIASTGVFRLANDEGIAWRNAANSANLLLKLNSSNRLELDGVAIPTISSTDTITNKTISGASNTISNVSLTSGVTGTLPVANGGTGITAFGTGVATALGQNVTGSGSIVLGSGATLTSPAITTPTGIVKGDVGLGNVDNTSDATKNSATATLTNKTISGASNTITNVSLTSGVTGTLPIGNGGTGQTVANDALNALLPSQTSNANKVLQTDGTNTSWASVAATVTTTRGDMVRRGVSADERFSAVTNNRVVRGNGTDVVSGQIDATGFFTEGAVVVPGTSAGIVSASGLPGNTTGNAIASGYVGQMLTSTVSGVSFASSATAKTATSITLTAGIWWVKGAMSISRGSASYAASSNIDLVMTLVTTADSLTGGAETVNQFNVNGTAVTTFSRQLITGVAYFRCDGTTIYREDGTALATGTTLRINGYPGTYTVANPSMDATITAIRIA